MRNCAVINAVVGYIHTLHSMMLYMYLNTDCTLKIHHSHCAMYCIKIRVRPSGQNIARGKTDTTSISSRYDHRVAPLESVRTLDACHL